MPEMRQRRIKSYKQKGNKMNITKKLQDFANLLEKEQIQRLYQKGLSCQANIDNCKTSIKEGKKYFKIDTAGSGKYMVDREGNIFGIKGYGIIHKGHCFGTLDTIDEYFWGEYRGIKKNKKSI